MKLYATVSSERATKGQGGKELMIEIMGDNKELVARVKVTRPPYMDYQIEVYPVVYPNKLMIDVKGHGYRLKRIETEKGEKQKGECIVNHNHEENEGIDCIIENI